MKTGSLAVLVTERRAARRALLAGTLIFSAIAILLAILAFALASPSQAQAQSNEIVQENLLDGSPKSEWDVQGEGDRNIQGFATDISVDQGQTVDFKVKTIANDYRLDIYRMGYYGGDGARKVTTIQPSAQLQNQPGCLNDSSTGLIDCGNWGVSASWDVPTDAVSGIYFAKLVREDVPGYTGGSHILFIVRDDDGNSDLLFQTADTTWQAYNQYSGNSLYTGQPAGRAYKVSYNRPITTRGTSIEDGVFNSEYPMVRWLERNGYDVSYFTGVDSDRFGAEIKEHKAFLSVGHDEYWSKTQRQNVEAARDAGVNLAFFSGNEVFWKTRWEDSHKTLVSYKETHAGAKIDPSPEWTGTWRDNRSFNPEGSQPENALTGTIFTVNCCTYNMEVPAADGKMRLWRDTTIATQAPNATATLPDGTLGYEWDEDLDNGFRPAGLVRMSSTTVDVPQRIQDNGSNYAPGTATHSLTMYRDTNGTGPDALVFGAGTVQWSWGLDSDHDRGSAATDPRVQQATVNLFADMGTQPATLQSDLTQATASTDTSAPSSTIDSPQGGATVEEGKPVTITGTASDGETGGKVGGVEVSVDGGDTWHRAEGRESWRYTWTPQAQGSATIQSRAADDSGNLGTASPSVNVTVGPRAPATCPCTIWDQTTTPTNPSENDTGAVELGVKFRSDTDGYITGVRFYKGSGNTGTHVGHLWTSGGQMLEEATFAGETASGWQEVRFDNPVQITKDTTYVASYHTPVGRYAADNSYFASGGVDNPPLHALANGHADGPNGVYKYGPSGSFPNETFQSSNYYVDVVFETSVGPDTRPPTVQSVSPASDQTGVNTSATVSAIFSEAMNAGTINPNTFELRDDSGNLVPVSRGYDAGTRTATLTPDAPLANSKIYTATVKGGSGGVEDAAGNALNADKTWSFTTAGPPPPPPDEGPGGPIAVISDVANPFGRYYAEILRNEGLNEFTAPLDISSVSGNTLDQYDTVILGDMPLTDAQVTMFSDWVNGGGNLIAMSPDPKLAGLLGLTNPSGTPLSEGYLKVDTTSAPGKGIVGETMQFHGAADRYDLGEARAVATLYSGANTATQNPAVTMRDVGTNGGQAAAFTYDLAKSVVYTRQGNPAWSGDERDGQSGPIRSDDLFFGAKAGDLKPDWVDLNKVAIPQADEQQRLLANLIGEMNLDKKPLPRFWYFPSGEKAAVVMTADGHPGNTAVSRFEQHIAQSPANCSVADWECIRATHYVYTPVGLTSAQADSYRDKGFEIALHVNTDCNNWTRSSLEGFYTNQLEAFATKFPNLPKPATNRTHCIAWSEYDTQPQVELQNGIRLDTNYYYWPGSWIQDRPGMFTGSGMPMRFAEADGSMIDVYQATTQMTDESQQTYPKHIDALLDKATGPEGYYGAFTTNIHIDGSSEDLSQTIVNSATSRGVPVVSARQMLEWVDGRNASSFENLSWSDNKLSFTVAAHSDAGNLQAMVPTKSDAGSLTGITRGGSPVEFNKQTIKGVEYAMFTSSSGEYVASYGVDEAAPAISALKAEPGADRSATISWTTDEPSTSKVEYGTSPDSLTPSNNDTALTTSHSVNLTDLAPQTTYYYRVSSTDEANNTATEPASGRPLASFQMPAAGLTADTTTLDFEGGTPAENTYVSQTGNGEVILKPTVGEEFSGSSLPSGWSSTPWTGGTSTVASEALTVDGARANTEASYNPGRSLEFTATFGAAPFQHVGFGTDFNGAPWAMFSTGGGSLPVGLYARTNGASQTNTPIAGVDPSQSHRYRVEWSDSNVVFYVDGTQVASHPITINSQMRPIASDFDNGGGTVTVDWLRMSDYASAGTFTSRVFDSTKSATEWLKLTSIAQTPNGTNVAFQTRSGNTADAEDGSWSGWAAVGADGTIASPDGQYVQYRASLSTSDPFISPAIEEVTLTSGAGGPDTTAPEISVVKAEPGADGSATISWITNESSDSLVEYGTSSDSLTENAPDATLVTSHSVRLTGLKAGTTYHYRVSSTDEANNTATEPPSGLPASFQTPDAGFTDTTTSDFEGGTPANTYVAQTSNGEVILKPTVGEEFSGSSLPTGWFGSPWTYETPGNATVASEALTVDGARAGTDATYGPGRSLEFVATFSGARNQHIGFGVDYDSSPAWAMFSTKTGGGLYARTNASGPETSLDSDLLNSPHRYRIEWKDSEVVYYVDGTEVARHPVVVTDQMRPLASDLNAGDGVASVDWLRMSSYATSGTFSSRVFDSGKIATDWLKLSSTQKPAAGTSVAFETRSGNSANAEDASWSSWEAVGADGTIASPDGQYVQYRASLSTSDPFISPAVEEVTFTYRLDEEPPAALSKPDLATDSDFGTSKTDDVTNDNTPTFTGTAEAGDTVEILVDGVVKGSGTATGGSYSVTVSDLGDGTHNVTARAADAAGNKGDESVALSVTVDTAAPDQVLQLEATGSEDGIALDWADNSDSRLAGYNVYRAGSSTGDFAKLNDALLTQSQYDDTEAPAGVDSYYRVTAVDQAGNESQPATASARRLEADTTAPIVSLTAPPNDGAAVRGPVTLSADASDNVGVDRVEFLVDGNVVGSDTSSPYSFAWDTTGISDGNKSITARAHDLAGNTTTSDARTVLIDNTAPAAPSRPDLATASDSGSDTADNVTNDNTPTFTGTAEAGDQVEILIDGAVKGSETATGGNYSVTVSALDDGPYNVTARATDVAGNGGDESVALAVTIDTQKPGAPTRVDLVSSSDLGASDTDNITSDSTPTFDVTAEAGSTVKIYKGSDTTALGSAQANGSGVASVTSSQLADGSYMISATATDVAGNVSESSATINVNVGVTVDTTRPAAPPRPDLVAASDTGTSSTDNITRETRPRFTSQAEAGSKVSVYDGGQLLGEVNATSTGTWNFQVTTPLSQGTHSITARATDKAGNVSAASLSLSINIDTTNPTITNLVPVPNTCTTDRTPTISATVQDDRATLTKSNITFFLDGAKVTTFSYDKTTKKVSYTPKKNLSTTGDHMVQLRVEDTAGNQQVNPSWRFTVRATCPPPQP